MNEEWKQNDSTESPWSEFETPYVSQYNYDAQAAQNLHSRAAVRSFLVVFFGLMITTVAAYVTFFSETILSALFLGGAFTFVLIAELVVVLVNSWAIAKGKLILSAVLYLIYTVLNGVTLSSVFLVYDFGSIKEAFLLAGLIFGVMAAYGYFTKKDLSQMGSIAIMALLGVVLVSLANAFLFHSTGLDLVMDYVVVLLFVGITAYDMNRMKQMVIVGGEGELNRVALFTGMQLYLDFINLFLRLIRILGKKR
ncbi:MAG: Bax inhibitor-1/YccA family protein [Lachnospiraceae bacterium]